MSDTENVIERALQRRHEIAVEWERIENFLQTAAELLGVSVERMINQQASAIAIEQASQPLNNRPSGHIIVDKDSTPSMPQHQFVETARHIIISKGEPLSSHRLLEGFKDLGQRVGGADELRNLTTKLWRAKEEIIKIKNLYWLVDVAYPKMNYYPDAPPGELLSGIDEQDDRPRERS